MKLLSFFLGAAFVVVISGQTDCDYDYVCDDTGSPGDLELAAPSALACYEACLAANVATPGDCLFWTYYEELGYGRSFDEETGTELDGVDGKLRASGKPVCRRLTSCDVTFDISDCGSTVGGAKCASGPGSCQACDLCDPLDYKAGSAAVAHWTCDVDLPYRKTALAPDTICRTECPSTSWTGNFAQAICESGCLGGGATGTWTLTTAAQDGTGADVTPTVDSDCLCDDIVLGKHQIPEVNGETSEAGARFYCDAVLTGADLNTVEYTNKCQLLCNGHLAMDIKCIAGSWTAGVQTNEDIYCWGPPQECDYNPGVNADVCTCSDDPVAPTISNICVAGDGCLTGTCLAACPGGPVTAADCFCETALGGGLCAVGSTCENGICT